MLFQAPDREQVQGVGGVILRDVLPKRDKLWIFYPGLLQLNLCLLGALACDVTNGYDNSMLNGECLSQQSWRNLTLCDPNRQLRS